MGGLRNSWTGGRCVVSLAAVLAIVCHQGVPASVEARFSGAQTTARIEQTPSTLPLRASIRVEPVLDPATQPQPANLPSLTSAVLGQPLIIAVDLPTGSVTGNTITVAVTEPYGASTLLTLTAQPGTSNGFTTFRTDAPVSFGAGRGGFTGDSFYYQRGTVNDLVQANTRPISPPSGDGLPVVSMLCSERQHAEGDCANGFARDDIPRPGLSPD